MPKTIFPVMAPLHNRYKGAEIEKDRKTGEDFVLCPFCSEMQEPVRVGLMDCVECGKTFESYLKDLEGE